MAEDEGRRQPDQAGGRFARRRARHRSTMELEAHATREAAGETEPSAMLDIRDLRIHFPTDDGLVKAVDGVSFALDRGRTLGVVASTALLTAAGSGLDKVVRCGVFLTDMREFPRMNAVYERMMKGNRPVRTTVQAAGLPMEGLKVEIDA